MNDNKRGGRYTPEPRVPEELEDRLRLVVEVLSGHKTVSSAAKELGLSRVQFQSVMHRAMSGALEAMSSKKPGPTPMGEAERTLRRDNEQLRRKVDRLEQRTEVYERFLVAAGDLLHERSQTPAPPTTSAGSSTSKKKRSKRKRKRRRSRPGTKTKDPEAERAAKRDLLRSIDRLREVGVHKPLIAHLLGTSESSMRRWARRERQGQPLPVRKRRAARVEPRRRAEVERLVRETRGLVGAESLRRSVSGVSRRQAAAIKKRTCTRMERERIERCGRVDVSAPGLLRGFDAMHIRAAEDRCYLLTAADGAVPYRTSTTLVPTYDGQTVADVIERDLVENGAPLAWRMDRASCQRTDDVQDLLDAHGVLVLHGPPRHPGYYGQHERQNREHRAWLADLEGAPASDIAAQLPSMQHALNALWRRPSLHWGTAAEAWDARPRLDVDRAELRHEVEHHAARIRADENAADDLAWRLAIEYTLRERGYLERRMGARC